MLMMINNRNIIPKFMHSFLCVAVRLMHGFDSILCSMESGGISNSKTQKLKRSQMTWAKPVDSVIERVLFMCAEAKRRRDGKLSTSSTIHGLVNPTWAMSCWRRKQIENWTIPIPDLRLNCRWINFRAKEYSRRTQKTIETNIRPQRIEGEIVHEKGENLFAFAASPITVQNP